MKKKEREIALEILKERSPQRFIKTVFLRKMSEYPELTAVQRAFIKRLVQGVVEREYTLDYVIHTNSSLRLKKIDSDVLNILRLSVYQIIYMDKIPPYSVVNEAVELVKKYRQFRAAAFTNAILRKVVDSKARIVEQLEALKITDPKTVYSFPQELIDLLSEEYSGEIAIRIMQHSLEEKPQTIRFHTGKEGAEKEIADFLDSKKDQIVGQGILFEKVCKYIGSIERENAFREGYLHIQDEASMLVGHLAAADQPQVIYDLCAAPGGKATHLAALLPESRIIACDISRDKTDKIEENKQRLGLPNLEIAIWDARKLDENKVGQADCVIADVPCSGLGVIGSKPDIKYRIDRKAIADLTIIQSEILEQAAKYVKTGGTLFYSTCTVSAAENQDRIRDFLQKHPEFELCSFAGDAVFQTENARKMAESGEFLWFENMLQILPQRIHGFFIAKLRKTL